MKIRLPQENEEIILLRPPQLLTSFIIRLENDEERNVISQDFTLTTIILPHVSSYGTNEWHCKTFQDQIQKSIQAWVKQSFQVSSTKTSAIPFYWLSKKLLPSLQAGAIEDITIDLTPLKFGQYFHQTNHTVSVALIINNEIKRRFILRWEPAVSDNPKSLGGSIMSPLPNKSLHEGSDELLYDDIQPLIIKNSESDNTPLKLHVLANFTEKTWIDWNNETPRLYASIEIDIQSNDEFSTLLKEKIQEAFDLQNVRVQLDNMYAKSALLFIPVRYVEDLVEKEGRFRIHVQLKSKDNKTLECDIPGMLRQLQVFTGHAALDFGTTNSSCVYFNLHLGRPKFPDKYFSPLQTKALQAMFEKLMLLLEEKTAQGDSVYQLLGKRFIDAARDVWRSEEGGRSQTFDAIRDYLKKLVQLKDESEISKMYANILVSWGILGYRDFGRKYQDSHQPIYKDAQERLAAIYEEYLNSIIDIDIQEDCQIFLPALEEKNPEGKIASIIRMDRLAQAGAETPYPTIDPFHSQIKMGTAIEEDMRDPQYRQSKEHTPPLPSNKEQHDLHDVFVAGAKRWIGKREKAYFIDKNRQIFWDTYNSVCTAGIKFLLNNLQRSISANKEEYVDDLVVTYPANLSQQRREEYRKLLASLGIGHIDMTFDEATAGALYYMWREIFADIFAGIDGFLARGHLKKSDRIHERTGKAEKRDTYFQNILLYDMGGGTTDIALLEISMEQLPVLADAPADAGRYWVIHPKILGLAGRENFGGDNVTLAIFRILKSKLATIVADKLLEIKPKLDNLSPVEEEVLKEYAENRQRFIGWFTEAASDPAKAYEQVKQDINALVPTDFKTAPKRQAAFFDMWYLAQQIKHDLSPPRETENDTWPSIIRVPGDRLSSAIQYPTVRISDRETIEIHRDEMEKIIRKDIYGTFIKARNLCIGLDDNRKPQISHYIDRVILAGSSSNLRLVLEVMPQEELGQPFTLPHSQQKLPAPFKYDASALIFHPKEAKLAVARGACLPRYFKRVQVNPKNPEIDKPLRKGISYLDFDTDNMRNYIPFTLTYQSGTAFNVAFEAGESMRIPSKSSDGIIRMVSRKSLIYSPSTIIYRVENTNQLSSEDADYYCQFELEDAIKKRKAVTLKEELEELSLAYSFYLEFDDERRLSCYMYTNSDGCAGAQYCYQTQPLNDIKSKDMLNTYYEYNDTPSNDIICIAVKLASGLGAQMLKIPIHGFTTIPFSPNVDIYTQDDKTLLWHISTDYQPKSPEFAAKLRLTLKLEKAEPILEYSIYDIDFDDPDHNIQIQPSFDNNRTALPFNPFKGEE